MARSFFQRTIQNITGKIFGATAEQIASELNEAAARAYPNSRNVAGSFRVMGDTDAAVSDFFNTRHGSVIIGSTLLGAYYAVYGNGGPDRIITSTRPYDRRGRPPGKMKLTRLDGSYRTAVHGFDPHLIRGKNFVSYVADKHR